MTPDQRLRLTYPYIADLPERPSGWGHDYDRAHESLTDRFGGPQSGRWYMLGLRAYFASEADCAAFCKAWGIERLRYELSV